MDPHKERIRKLVELTNSEKRGILFFLFLVFLILYLPKIGDRYFNDSQDLAGLGIQVTQLKQDEANTIEERSRHEYSMSQFDPNTSSVQELKGLGIPDFLAKRIDKYRQAGGRFKSSEDLLKIYGFNEDLYIRLKPFIIIEEKPKFKKIREKSTKSVTKEVVNLDINGSDSAQLVRIRGIGPVYASRIIKYRNALGGYYKLEQVKEVYGINDSLFNAIEENIFIDKALLIERLPINRIDKKELRSHPYFRSYNMCNAIIKYRDQHGDFQSTDELRNIHLMNDSIIERIAPYLSFE